MKKCFKILILAVFAALLTSCAFSGDNAESETPVQPQEAVQGTQEEAQTPAAEPVLTEGNVITIDTLNPQTFNPILNEDLSVDRLLRLIYLPLVAVDTQMKPSPSVASSWEFSPDGLSLTVHIREGMTWEDGESVTAYDAEYTLNAINASPETALYKNCMKNMTGYSVIDPKTLKITYAKPYAGALYSLTFPVLPRHYFSTARTDGEQLAMPLGNGLYALSEFNVMRDLTLVAAERSYLGKPKIPEIKAIIVRNRETALYAYEQGILDLAEANLANWKKMSTSRQSNIFMGASASYEFLAVNFRNAALRSLDLRKAIAHAVPKTEILEKIYGGNGFLTDTPVNPRSWLYEPYVAGYELDLEKAAQYKELSGFVQAEGEAFVILVNSDNQERILTAETISGTLSEIDIRTEIVSVPFEDYVQRLKDGAFDLAVCGLHMPMDNDLSPIIGNIGGVPGENNFTAYKDDIMDGYLAQAEVSVFEEAQKAAFSNIQAHFAGQLPFVSLLYKANVTLTGKNVQGDIAPVINNAYNNIGELTIFEELE